MFCSKFPFLLFWLEKTKYFVLLKSFKTEVHVGVKFTKDRLHVHNNVRLKQPLYKTDLKSWTILLKARFNSWLLFLKCKLSSVCLLLKLSSNLALVIKQWGKEFLGRVCQIFLSKCQFISQWLISYKTISIPLKSKKIR